MTACGPNCGWCGRCTAAWDREDEEPEPDICDYCSRPLTPDVDHAICLVNEALDNTFDEHPF